jgi:hypothetical protein
MVVPVTIGPYGAHIRGEGVRDKKRGKPSTVREEKEGREGMSFPFHFLQNFEFCLKRCHIRVRGGKHSAVVLSDSP